jgi:hypothetical protein
VPERQQSLTFYGGRPPEKLAVARQQAQEGNTYRRTISRRKNKGWPVTKTGSAAAAAHQKLTGERVRSLELLRELAAFIGVA